MSNHKAAMSIERAAAIIDAYGSDTQRWPAHERDAAVTIIERSPRLQERLQDAAQLDAALQTGYDEQPVDEVMLAGLVAKLPEQQVDVETSTRSNRALQWPVGIAAAITGLLISVAVFNGNMGEQGSGVAHEQVALQDIDYWLWQDVTGQVSFDTEEEPVTDFLALL